MSNGLEEAGRHLQMVDEHLSQESLDQGDICMTQVPEMFSEEEAELETEVPDNDVLISTQVQGVIEDMDRQETVVHSFRNTLSRFALETQDPEQVPARPALKTGSKVVKLNRKSKPRTVQKRIKSITQFNTDKWEETRVKDRAQKMISMLSGKSIKAKKLVSRLNLESLTGSGVDSSSKEPEPTRFATFNETEWHHILSLLLEKLPKLSRTEISSVQNYVYGESFNLWEASQQTPERLAQNEDAESETVLPSLKLSDSLPVYTLSQLVEGNSIETNQSRDRNESLQPISIDVPSSETDIPSQVSDSCDTASLISVDETADDWTRDALDNESFPGRKSRTKDSPVATTLRGGPASRDQLISVSQNSFSVISSVVSPMKANRMETIQVPATRTATVQEVSQHRKNSELEPRNKAVKVYVEHSQDESYAMEELRANIDTQQQDSLSTLTTSMLHGDDNEIYIDSEDDKASYSIVEVKDAPQLDLSQRPVLRPSPSSRIKTPVSAEDSLESQLQPSLLTTQNASPNTAKLRQSLKAIGLKPCKNKVQMLQVWDTLQAKFPGSSDTDGPVLLKQFLTDLIVEHRDESATLMEQIYTFEPIRFEQLKSWLVSLNSFSELIDDSFIKNWADLNGIVFRNDSIDTTQSQTRSQLNSECPSQSLSQLQSPSLSP